MTKIEKYVLWTHVYQPLVCIVKDTYSDNYGKYWILTDNKNINGKYLTFPELVEFWDNNPDWRKEIVLSRLNVDVE